MRKALSHGTAQLLSPHQSKAEKRWIENLMVNGRDRSDSCPGHPGQGKSPVPMLSLQKSQLLLQDSMDASELAFPLQM